MPELDYVVAARARLGQGGAPTTAPMELGLAGIDIDREPGFQEVVQVREGSLDELAEPDTILIFEEQAKKLEVKVGDTLTLSAPTIRGANNTVDVRVVAIAANMGLLSAFNIFMPDDDAARALPAQGRTTGALQLYLKDLTTRPRCRSGCATALARRRLPGDGPDPRPSGMKFETGQPRGLDRARSSTSPPGRTRSPS